MEMKKDDEKKVVEIWLTHAEGQDPDVESRLKPLYKACKENKYLAVVYRSGTGSFLELTRDLLVYNYNNPVSAKAETGTA